jgi:CubicO group peptidase (beta-lactamase class C family)
MDVDPRLRGSEFDHTAEWESGQCITSLPQSSRWCATEPGQRLRFGQRRMEEHTTVAVRVAFHRADGGLLMNVIDLAKWDAALYTEQILKRSSFNAMWTPVPLDDGSAYPGGIGWFIANAKGHRIVFHTGGG